MVVIPGTVSMDAGRMPGLGGGSPSEAETMYLWLRGTEQWKSNSVDVSAPGIKSSFSGTNALAGDMHVLAEENEQ